MYPLSSFIYWAQNQFIVEIAFSLDGRIQLSPLDSWSISNSVSTKWDPIKKEKINGSDIQILLYSFWTFALRWYSSPSKNEQLSFLWILMSIFIQEFENLMISCIFSLLIWLKYVFKNYFDLKVENTQRSWKDTKSLLQNKMKQKSTSPILNIKSFTFLCVRRAMFL